LAASVARIRGDRVVISDRQGYPVTARHNPPGERAMPTAGDTFEIAAEYARHRTGPGCLAGLRRWVVSACMSR